MLRKLLSRLLRLDLQSQIHWSDTETMAVISRISFEQLQPGRTETIDLVLCRSGDDYVLYKKWRRSGDLIRIRFSQRLEGKEMRLKQMTPPPNLLYRLFLQPVGGTPVEYAEANPFWFGFWRNEIC